MRKLLASAVAVLLFLGTLEIGLRLVYKPRGPFRFYEPHSESIVQRDSELGYRLRPNIKANAYKSFIQTNSLGFRGPEFNPASKTGTRIVALGDSCTFGFGISDNAHTYPAVLSTLMRAEVINAGVVGYTSYQASKLLETQLVGFHPDIVLIRTVGTSRKLHPARLDATMVKTSPPVALAYTYSLPFAIFRVSEHMDGRFQAGSS